METEGWRVGRLGQNWGNRVNLTQFAPSKAGIRQYIAV
jgi:hypothetical protein